jgi:Flp pilus assembly protein TadB
MALRKMEKKQSTGEKVLKGSFWLIAAIHITVFTTIGAATGRWRLLIVFIVGFVAVMAAYALFRLWRARRK